MSDNPATSYKIRYNESLGEYRVVFFDNCGKRCKNSDYFTDDKQDAKDTAEFTIRLNKDRS